MKSAIELYQEAYSLHFKEGKPELARELYKEIIERYPDSDERKYSQFQLARTPSPVVASPMPSASASFPVVTSVALFVALIAISVTVGLFFLMKDQQKSSLYLEKIILATKAIQSEDFDDATLLLREAKLILPDRMAAYALASGVYAKKNRFDLAEAEYKLLLSMDPANTYAQEQLNMLARKKDEYKLTEQEKLRQQETLRAQEEAAAAAAAAARAPRAVQKPEPAPEETQEKKSPEVIDNSGVSYF